MPIYAYRCESCGFEKDALQKMSDAPLTQCPQCGKETFVKQVTAAGFQLKGSGWYVTDFRGGNNGAAAASKKEEGGKRDEGAKAETKSESASDSGNSSNGSSKDSGNQSSKTDSSTASAPAASSTTSAAASSGKPASPASN